MSKFIISGFYDEATSNFTEQLKLVRELKEEYICPRSISGKNISGFTLESFNSDILPALKEYGVKISTIGSPYGKVGLNDEEGFQTQLNKLTETVKICQAIGCKYIRMFSFFVTSDYEGAKPEVIRKLKLMLEKVEGTDVILLHENEKGIYGNAPDRCIALYKEINHPQFKLCYDASNYVQCGFDPWKAYEDTREFTVEYHMKDCGAYKVEVPLGLGEGRIADILADLNKRGYEGFLTLEPHTYKYAKGKIALYIMPLVGLLLKGWRPTFKYIDKALGKKPFEKVSAREIFIIQYNNLVEMLKKL